MKKVCIIIPFYGKWPVYFDLFIKSCSFNKWIDILFITDLGLPGDCPENVRKVHISFEKLRNLMSDKLGHDVALVSYYKLCDLKPMYGHIFSDFLKQYTFWGFGDIDLVYGNTRRFLTDEILDYFDIITFRTEWLSGALTLFRNNDYINTLFKKSPDWVKVVSTNKHFSFTECAQQYQSLLSGTSIFDIKGEVLSMTAVCKQELLNERLTYFEKKIIRESIPKGAYMVFDSGEIRDSAGTEYLLYHYISNKPKPFFVFPTWKVVPDKFFITKTGFYSTENFKYEPLIKIIRLTKISEKILTKLKAKLPARKLLLRLPR